MFGFVFLDLGRSLVWGRCVRNTDLSINKKNRALVMRKRLARYLFKRGTQKQRWKDLEAPSIRIGEAGLAKYVLWMYI